MPGNPELELHHVSEIPPGGLTTTILHASQAICAGGGDVDRAGRRAMALSAQASDPVDRVTISGGSLEGAMVDLMTSSYRVAAAATVIERSDDALETVFEVFGPS